MRFRNLVATAVVAVTMVVGATPVASVAATPEEQAGAIIDAASLALRGRLPGTQERGDWLAAMAIGNASMADVGREIAIDRYRAGGIVVDLYQETLGRAPDVAGRAYWEDRLMDDRPLFKVEAGFFASPEYFGRSGGTNTTYVEHLYTGILGRPRDIAGRDFWVDQLAQGVRRSTVALRFLNTPEVRGTKADAVFQALFDRPATHLERVTWGPKLVTMGDAGLLVGSRAYAEHVNPPTPEPLCDVDLVPGTQTSSDRSSGLSDDGTLVVFATPEDGVVAGDTDHQPDVFLRDLEAGTTTLLSTGPGAAEGPSMTGDGGFVTWSRRFEVEADLHDIDVWDAATGTVTRATTGTGNDLDPTISADGRHLAYSSGVPDPEPWSGSPGLTKPLITDVVVRDRTAGTSTVLPQLLVNETAPAISPDGAWVAYQSSTRVPVVEGVPRDASTGHTVALWRRSTGTATEVPGSTQVESLAPDISDDGQTISLNQYDPRDRVDRSYAVEWDVAAGAVELVEGAGGTALTPAGLHLAFGSSHPLVASDDDQGSDVYVRDRPTETLQRLTEDTNGARVTGIASDGSVVLFEANIPGTASEGAVFVCTRAAPVR